MTPHEAWTLNPTIDGWYEVQWELGDVPQEVYLTLTPAETMAKYGIERTKPFYVWGFGPCDDPEAVEFGESEDGQYPRCRRLRSRGL